MWSCEGLETSIYLDEIDTSRRRSRKEEGQHVAVSSRGCSRVKTSTCEVHKEWNPIGGRSGLRSVRVHTQRTKEDRSGQHQHSGYLLRPAKEMSSRTGSGGLANTNEYGGSDGAGGSG